MASPSTYLEWCGIVLGTWEPQVRRVVISTLQIGDGAIDVGANIGLLTLAMARAVGPSGRVVALEAVPQIADSLEHNVRLNDLTNVEVVRAAASSKEGRGTLYLSDEGDRDMGHGTLTEPADTSTRTASDVVLTTVDACWPADTNLRLMKIDVEGHEIDVLHGAHGTIRRWRPTITFEYEPTLWASAGHKWEDLEGALGVGAYRLSTLPLRGRARHLLSAPRNTCDVIASPV